MTAGTELWGVSVNLYISLHIAISLEKSKWFVRRVCVCMYYTTSNTKITDHQLTIIDGFLFNCLPRPGAKKGFHPDQANDTKGSRSMSNKPHQLRGYREILINSI